MLLKAQKTTGRTMSIWIGVRRAGRVVGACGTKDEVAVVGDEFERVANVVENVQETFGMAARSVSVLVPSCVSGGRVC